MSSLAKQTWLILRNDLRLLWRDLLATRLKEYLSIALAAALFCLFNAIAIGVFFAFRRSPPLAYETFAWLLFGLMMVSVAINHAIAMLFERSDFDLLLPSPISPRAILLARVAALTTGAAMSVAMFLLPLLNGALLAVSPGYATGYAVWLLLACATASGGIWFTLLLVKWLGPQRARTWAQVIAALLGTGLFIVLQSSRYLDEGVAAVIFQPVVEQLGQPPISFVAQAARGELLPLLTLTGVTVIFVLLTVRRLARVFIGGVQDASAAAPRRSGRSRRHVFESGLGRATFRKDFKLIVRDPLLLAQTLPMTLYFIPLLLGFGRMSGFTALTATSVLVAGTFSMLLTYVAASGEECWDLVRMSPADEMRLRYGKMAAGMALPTGLALLMNVIAATGGHLLAAFFGTIMSLLIAAGSARLAIAHIRPTPRRDILKKGTATGVPGHLNILATGLGIAGAGAVGLLANRMWISGSIVFVVAVLLVAACFMRAEYKLQRVQFSEA